MEKNKYKYKFRISIERAKDMKKFRTFRIANAYYIWWMGFHVTIAMPYKKAFIYSEGWNSGWRVAKGIANE